MTPVFKMKTLVLFALCCTASVLAEDDVKADNCTTDVCRASDGCLCATSASPLGSEKNTPQLISLTFNEAITYDNYYGYWKPLLFDRVNPDKQPIGATFFVSHEYTDYECVNGLYNHGFEIGVHSITDDSQQAYWRGASQELLEKEFGGQKKILNKFGNIPEEDVIGVRTPQFQLAGNVSIKAYQTAGFLYDSSWPTFTREPLYPYTLDYLSTQECLLGNECPNEAFKGFWVLPINNIHGSGFEECNNIPSCGVTGTADEIATWLATEIESIRSSTKVPLTLILSSSWFSRVENSLEGFTKFLDKLATYEDVFLVSQKQVFDWIKNPVPLSEFKTDFTTRDAPCTAYSCKLYKELEGERYMKSCIICPNKYPWLNNPDGN